MRASSLFPRAGRQDRPSLTSPLEYPLMDAADRATVYRATARLYQTIASLLDLSPDAAEDDVVADLIRIADDLVVSAGEGVEPTSPAETDALPPPVAAAPPPPPPPPAPPPPPPPLPPAPPNITRGRRR